MADNSTPRSFIPTVISFLQKMDTSVECSSAICVQWNQYQVEQNINPRIGFYYVLDACGVSWTDWPEFSGNIIYPICTAKKAKAEEQFNRHIYYWRNDEYGNARRRLRSWLMEQLNEIRRKERPAEPESNPV